ncbi:conserved hypothetical protein [Hyphomicrobiales bacterium]|nr:conserved hypothetical protein [Hyphomicrobiales bacterium]CAH1697850.1 conserved hypothetical protein [Hyphomicrobiales bacterium]CAI0347496.1 conserved hypothetical protein [Hyphomicrobiales bacterium]
MSRLRFSTAREVFETYPSAREFVGLAPTNEPPLTFLARLAKGPAPMEAAGFCAFLLPRRETVWWALQAVRSMQPPGTPDPGLATAEAWVREPGDKTRFDALRLAQSGDRTQPGTFIAWAAGYSGGSMAEGHAIPCPPDLTAKMARIAVLIAINRLPARERAGALHRCVEACIRLADDDPGTR